MTDTSTTRWALALLCGLLTTGCSNDGSDEQPASDERDQAASTDEAEPTGDDEVPEPEASEGPLATVGAWNVPEESKQLNGMAVTDAQLYAVSNRGHLLRFDLAPDTGEVGEAHPLEERGDLAHGEDVFVAGSGEQVWVIGNTGGTMGKRALYTFSRAPDSGALSLDDSASFPHGHDHALTADASFAYLTASRDHELTIHRKEDDEYATVETMKLVDAPNSSGGSSLAALSPDDTHLYVTTDRAYDDDREKLHEFQLIVYARDAETGTLEEVQRLEHEEDGVELDQPKAMAVSPTGDRVFVALSGFQGPMSIFERDAASGELSYATTQDLKAQPPGAEQPAPVTTNALAVGPDGSAVYATATANGAAFIAQFALQ